MKYFNAIFLKILTDQHGVLIDPRVRKRMESFRTAAFVYWIASN